MNLGLPLIQGRLLSLIIFRIPFDIGVANLLKETKISMEIEAAGFSEKNEISIDIGAARIKMRLPLT